MTIKRCTEKRSRLPAIPRSPDLSAAMGSALVPRKAGMVPKTIQVRAATTAAKSNTRQSVVMAR